MAEIIVNIIEKKYLFINVGLTYKSRVYVLSKEISTSSWFEIIIFSIERYGIKVKVKFKNEIENNN